MVCFGIKAYERYSLDFLIEARTNDSMVSMTQSEYIGDVVIDSIMESAYKIQTLFIIQRTWKFQSF